MALRSVLTRSAKQLYCIGLVRSRSRWEVTGRSGGRGQTRIDLFFPSIANLSDVSSERSTQRDFHTCLMPHLETRCALPGLLCAASARCMAQPEQQQQQQQQRRYGDDSSSSKTTRVISVQSEVEFDKAMQAAKDAKKLAVIDFTADWCSPCKRIAPLVDKLSNEYADVDFIKVDIDEPDLDLVVQNAKITAVPTFHFHKGGRKVAEFSGGDSSKLKDILALLHQGG